MKALWFWFPMVCIAAAAGWLAISVMRWIVENS